MKAKNEALIRVIISTYFRNGNYRSNIVEIPIPVEVANVMQENNHDIAPKTVAKYLASNQVASFKLIVNGQCVGGIQGMCESETFDETWVIQEESEDED